MSVVLPEHLLRQIDTFKAEWGLRTRGDILERLLLEVFPQRQEAEGPAEPAPPEETLPDPEPLPTGALVLMRKEGSGELVCGFDPASPVEAHRPRSPSARAGGIDLPGFVRGQSQQLRNSLSPEAKASHLDDPLPQVQLQHLSSAIQHAESHWMEIYGSAPGEAVLEAAMVWLAQDIWPQSDLSDGRPFTWSLVNALMQRLAEGWEAAPASFGRVVVVAGVLEDPFSTETLELRQPTLIRRFVQRFRRRKRGMSFEMLSETMTLQGALRLLKLPTTPGHRLNLEEIRQAYRELALTNHPDAGGCDQTMRRLNEAYQLLRDQYR